MSIHNDHRALQRVLCIDDDDEYNFLTEDAFSECNFNCELIFKTDSTEALDYLYSLETFPDIILLDINMPIINGWEFLHEYQNREYHIRHDTSIFMHSSSVYEEDRIKAKAFAKVIGFVEKPIESSTIDKLCELYFPETKRK